MQKTCLHDFFVEHKQFLFSRYILLCTCTLQIDAETMRRVASYPPETHYFQATDYATVNSILSDLIDSACSVATQADPTIVSTTTKAETTTMIMTTSTTPKITTSPSDVGGEDNNTAEGGKQ